MIKSWAIIALIAGNKGANEESKNRATTIVSKLFLHGYEIQEPRSEIVRGGRARVNSSWGAHCITHARVFSTSRMQRASNPFRLAAFARQPNGYQCIRHCEHANPYLVKEAFRICTDSARHSRERSSINNTPYAMSPHSLRSDTRYREVVTVYYTPFNWHR